MSPASPICAIRSTPSKRASEPYDASVSAATRMPPLYFTPTTEPPVTMGLAVRCESTLGVAFDERSIVGGPKCARRA